MTHRLAPRLLCFLCLARKYWPLHTLIILFGAFHWKDSFLKNGFHIVYEKDGDDHISDGFFFTVGYQDMNSEKLQKELLRYGISTISLPCTGSTKDGVRVCVSMMTEDHLFDKLEKSLKLFNNDHK